MLDEKYKYISDPQVRLRCALANHKIDEFRMALDLGADPLLLDESQICIFEIALSTYGCVEFVTECLRHGCSVSYRNPCSQKAAGNSAAESMDKQIIDEFIHSEGIFGVSCTFRGLTPLNSLAKNLTNENFKKVFDCTKILLEGDASPHVPDENDMTPLHYILQNDKINQNQKSELFQEYFKTKAMDYKSLRDGELESILCQEYNDMPIEYRTADNIELKLMNLIHTNAEKLRNLFQIYQNFGKIRYVEIKPLLEESILFGKNEAFDIFIQHADLISIDKMVHLAIIYGNAYALKEILRKTKMEVNTWNLCFWISLFMLRMGTHFSEHCDYRSCLYILLESINEHDEYKSSGLRMAIDVEDEETVQELLKRGAFTEPNIARMDAKLLEQHFDSCITSNNKRMNEHSFKIFIDYKNFPSENRSQLSGFEMRPIARIAASKNHRHLLKHPLITSLLYLKWTKLAGLIYLNILYFTLFAFSTVGNATLKLKNIDYYNLTQVLSTSSWICIGYMALRETLQFVMSPRHYLTSIPNYKELTLIILSILSSMRTNFEAETQKGIIVSCFLLIAWELCDILGSLPIKSISLHMLMLKTFCKTFMKTFALYSIFILTFCLCFYILFGQAANNSATEEAVGKSDFHNFTNPAASLLKIVVMFTGELEASSLDYNSKFCYFFLLIFIISMTIVLSNLINGLAISDTQKVMEQAELSVIIYRINLLERYEDFTTLYTGRFNSIIIRKLFRFLMNSLNLHPVLLGCQKLFILANEKKTIGLELKSLEINASLESTCMWMETVKMDDETVNSAKSILIKNAERHRAVKKS